MHQDCIRIPPLSMSTTVAQPVINSRIFSKHPTAEEPVSYCAPWDLKSQEEKLKLLTNNQQQKQSTPSSPAHTNLITRNLSNESSPSTFRQQNIIETKQQLQPMSLSANALLHPETSNLSLSINNSNNFYRTRSARTSKNSFHIQTQPPIPPLPPGGLKSTCYYGPGTEIDPSLKKIAFCLNAHALRCTDTSRSFMFSGSTDKPQQHQPLTVKIENCLVIENKQQQQSPLQSKSNTSTLSTTSSISPLPNRSSSSNDSFPNKIQTTTVNGPLSFEEALSKFKRLSSTRSTISSSSSLKHDQQSRINNNEISYERPWDAMQTSLIGSLSSPSTTAITSGLLGKNVLHIENNLKLKRGTSSPPPQIVPVVRTPYTMGKCCNINNVHQADTIVETNKLSFRGRCSSPSLIIKATENNAVDKELPIDRYFWYHYSLPRRKAETLLYNRPCGSFLVRQSESGNKDDYSLSIRTINGCVHMRICSNNGVYILGQCSHPFPTVPRMIEYYSQCEVPIKGVQHVKLADPVFRSTENDLL